MRKFFAISILALLSFYWWGYQLVFESIDVFVAAVSEQRIQAGQYQSSQLKTIVVDLELPYTNNWQAFEKIEGEIWVDGIPHHYVERIYVDGKMIYHCLPDANLMKINEAKTSVASFSFDLEKQDSKNSSKMPSAQLKKLITECEEIQRYRHGAAIGCQPLIHYCSEDYKLSRIFQTISTPPPDFLLS